MVKGGWHESRPGAGGGVNCSDEARHTWPFSANRGCRLEKGEGQDVARQVDAVEVAHRLQAAAVVHHQVGRAGAAVLAPPDVPFP